MRVEFHTGIADDIGFACRLLRKAYRQGSRVLVRAPTARLARLDRELWSFVEREFIPHLRFTSPGPLPAQAARTPIWLVDGAIPQAPPPLLVNLGAPGPETVQGFSRIIEIVGTDPEEARRGRERWRDFKAQGHEMVHHAESGGN